MDYLKDSFSVNVGQNKNYRNNWDSIFGGPKFYVIVSLPNGDHYLRLDSNGLRLVNKSNSTYFRQNELESAQKRVLDELGCESTIREVEAR